MWGNNVRRWLGEDKEEGIMVKVGEGIRGEVSGKRWGAGGEICEGR